MNTTSALPSGSFGARRGKPPLALYALTIGAFGIGTTEFVIMGLLLQLAADLHTSVATAGLLISGYALGVFAGAPLLTAAMARVPRKTALLALMAIFTLGNVACALAPNYGLLMAARIVTSLAHGTFFGIGAVVATGLVPAERKASAISTMFTGLTVATLLGVPAGAWLGLHEGWRATFWAVSAIGVLAMAVIALAVPARAAGSGSAVSLGEELAVLRRPQVLLGLGTTVLGFAGVFLVFTFIQPLLTQLAGFDQAGVSAVLLVFGVGMIAGNVIGGRWADKAPKGALLGTLVALALVLVAMGLAMGWGRGAATVAVGLLGAAGFATVAPLQLRVLTQAQGASMASSLNIAAFNLGNALGAWLGGVVIERGPGLAALPYAAALLTLGGLGLAWISLRAERPKLEA
ncbi:MFS transporter [Pelomonas sp. KK5]|uniref:MFS transporter n=1 Tax=Pelomonas sp. KK5 TaxID=1855730 RepID=UPI00097BCC39|nr:MFS transporter [Pelomonas sp. KK5]